MRTIGLLSPLKLAGHQRLLDSLGDVFDVRFELAVHGTGSVVDAYLCCEADQAALQRIASIEYPCYTVLSEDLLVPCGNSSAMNFSTQPFLPRVLSGRQVVADDTVDLKGLPSLLENLTALTSKQGIPVWGTIGSDECPYHHYVSVPLPEMKDGEHLFQYFNGRKFFQLLPLMLFLQALTEDTEWEPPPLQACFMFDDPNLHWPTYGFIDFAAIAQHALRYNYHVSFATIPLDGKFIHKPTASIFHQYTDRLSLLVHGNDHIAQEFARPYSKEELNSMSRQALDRVSDLERRSGVEVARVMAPPHGACSEVALAELARVGFEAACISQGSLRRYNSEAGWLRTIGMRPSDSIQGLPIFPRFPLSRHCHNNILIAALLHQPIIPVGHHRDVAEGLQLLVDLSQFMNSLGDLYWRDMKRITRSHYASKRDGGILRVKMYTKRVEILIPEGVNRIRIERECPEKMPETILWREQGGDPEWKQCLSSEAISVISDQRLEFTCGVVPTAMELQTLRDSHLWPFIRRNFTEIRDRITPLLQGLVTTKMSK